MELLWLAEQYKLDHPELVEQEQAEAVSDVLDQITEGEKDPLMFTDQVKPGLKMPPVRARRDRTDPWHSGIRESTAELGFSRGRDERERAIPTHSFQTPAPHPWEQDATKK